MIGVLKSSMSDMPLTRVITLVAGQCTHAPAESVGVGVVNGQDVAADPPANPRLWVVGI